MVFYFQYEKARLDRKRVVEMSKGYGKPKVGGPFKLKDLTGKEFTEKDLLGKYSLVRTLMAIQTMKLIEMADLLWVQSLPRYLS